VHDEKGPSFYFDCVCPSERLSSPPRWRQMPLPDLLFPMAFPVVCFINSLFFYVSLSPIPSSVLRMGWSWPWLALISRRWKAAWRRGGSVEMRWRWRSVMGIERSRERRGRGERSGSWREWRRGQLTWERVSHWGHWGRAWRSRWPQLWRRRKRHRMKGRIALVLTSRRAERWSAFVVRRLWGEIWHRGLCGV
jgi:hypothetical protein